MFVCEKTIKASAGEDRHYLYINLTLGFDGPYSLVRTLYLLPNERVQFGLNVFRLSKFFESFKYLKNIEVVRISVAGVRTYPAAATGVKKAVRL